LNGIFKNDLQTAPKCANGAILKKDVHLNSACVSLTVYVEPVGDKRDIDVTMS